VEVLFSKPICDFHLAHRTSKTIPYI